MKALIIAEKPAAGKDIAKVLGVTKSFKGYMEDEDYIVTWAVGHMVTLRDPEDHDSRYAKWNVDDLPLPASDGLKVIESAKSQFQIVKKLISRDDISYLINAGDAGREGLLIQNWIYRMAGNRHPIKILWASSLTDEAIKTALNRLHDNDEEEFVNLMREAETRAEADKVYGYNYTRLLTCMYGSPGTVLSYGRCQTPLLNLIYKRDMEIEKFVSQPYWNLITEFENGFNAMETETDDNGKIITKRYMNKAEAENAYSSCGNKGIVKSCRSEDKSSKAPVLFNLAEIQGTMGKKYGLKPDETLAIAQKLYETYKILSYPRTDSRYLSTDIYGEIGEHIKSCCFGKFKPYIDKIDFSAFTMDKAYFNNNKVSDHHALIPTINSNIESIYGELNENEKHFFDEIVVSLIAIFYPAYRYESTELNIDVSGRAFQCSGTVIKDMGFKTVYQALGAADDEQEQIIPKLAEGADIHISKLLLKEDKTKPPARYNPGNIIKLMNKYKIGTSATAANIVQILEKRGFIKLDAKKKYASTELGREFLNIVPDVLKSKNLTIEFEEKLQKVNAGKITKEKFIREINEQIRQNIEIIKKQVPDKKLGGSESIGRCPVCGKSMREGKKNWYCEEYSADPKCTFAIWKEIAGKNLSASDVHKLLSEGKTGIIKGFKSSKGNSFNARLFFKDDFTLGFQFPAV